MSTPAALHDLKFLGSRRRGPARIELQWEAPEDTVGDVELELRTAGVPIRRTLPAAALGIRGTRGAGSLDIDTRRLPAGPAELSMRLLEARTGKVLAGAELGFEVPGCRTGDNVRRAGKVVLDLRGRRVRRPRGEDRVFVRGRVEGAAPGDVTSLIVVVAGPDGAVEAVDLPADPQTLPWLVITAAHAVGAYRLRVLLVTDDGSLLATEEAGFELAEDGEHRGPEIASVMRGEADEVVLTGSALDGPRPEVSFAGVTVGISGITADRLVATPPDIDAPAQAILRNSAGIAVAPVPYRPRPRVRVIPEELAIAPGDSLQLTAAVTRCTDGRVAWTVDRRSGLRIDEHGRLTVAPDAEPGAFEVVARSLVDPEAIGRARGVVAPRTELRSPEGVLGRAGGRLECAASGLALIVPPGAVRRAGRFSLTLENAAGSKRDDLLVLAAAGIDGPPQRLDPPALLRLPLRVPVPPGTEYVVEVSHGRGPSRPVPLEPLPPKPGGSMIEVFIDRIPGRVRVDLPFGKDFAWPRAIAAPRIGAITGFPLEEGATVALQVEGANFVPGLTSVSLVDVDGLAGGARGEVLADFDPRRPPSGAPASTSVQVDAVGNATVTLGRSAIRSVAVTADARTLGIVVKIGILPNLGEGQTGVLQLRVSTALGAAEAPLPIIGHDELFVTAGTRTISASARFSAIAIAPGAALLVASQTPPIRIEAVEAAWLGSTIEGGGGIRVPHSSGGIGQPGDVLTAAGAGGAAGAGITAAGLGAGGAGGAGGVGGAASGVAGGAGSSALTLTRAGAGGNGGAPGGGGPFPHAGGAGGNGSSGARVFAPGLLDLSGEPGPGGGGGGGGGGEGWIFQTRGAGGGGGGAGGGALVIAAGEGIQVTGDVLALGGNGAPGQFPLTVVSPIAPNLIQAGEGGAGGGGAGGWIQLSGVVAETGTVVAAGGDDGRPARYGAPIVDARTARQRILGQPASGMIVIEGRLPAVTVGTVFRGPDMTFEPNLLAVTPSTVVSTTAADELRVTRANGQTDTVLTFGQDATTVPLFPGYNEISAVGYVGARSAPIRNRRILYLPNTAAVFAFNAVVTPAQATVPTERSVALNVAVTSTPPSPVQWRVVGGADNGTVTPRLRAPALYTAPCRAPVPAGVNVHAESVIDPQRFGSALLTIVPGIEVTSVAASGQAADASVASANVGQVLLVRIPPAVFAQTQETFPPSCSVRLSIHVSLVGPTWVTATSPYPASVLPGQQTLEVAVPAGATADQWIRVPGHGCARLLVVPAIASAAGDAASFPAMIIEGEGFDPRDTQVVFSSGPVPAADVQIESPRRIRVAFRPAPGTEIRVRTAGGTSAGFLFS